MTEVAAVRAHYQHASDFLRFHPRLRLRDVDGAWLMHYLNASLARKLKAVHVFANGYKLEEYGADRWSIDADSIPHSIPPEFLAEELEDPWVRIRGGQSSVQTLDFYECTPRRLFSSREITSEAPRTS